MKIACVAFGNKGIFYQGLATLSSVKKHNPAFDLWLCTSSSSYSHKEVSLAAGLDINILNFSSEMSGYINSFVFDANIYTWPRETFLRFILPGTFAEMGYDYIILIDCDMLCIAPYIYDEILPYDVPFGYRPSNTLGVLFQPGDIEKISVLTGLNANLNASIPTPNAGFLVFNGKKYHDFLSPQESLNLSNKLNSFNKYISVDELVMGLAGVIKDFMPKMIPVKYNRTLYFSPVYGETINLHLGCDLAKPWAMKDAIRNQNIVNKYPYIFPVIPAYLLYLDHIRGIGLVEEILGEKFISPSEILEYSSVLEMRYNAKLDGK